MRKIYMRNKVVLVSKNAEYRNLFDQVLTPWLGQGGELFFADHLEQLPPLLEKEHPCLLCIDEKLRQNFTLPASEIPILWIEAPLSPEELLSKVKPHLDETLTINFPPL